MNINKYWIDYIKTTNKNVTYIAFSKYNEDEFLDINIKNELGGKDKVKIKCVEGADKMRSEEWEYIIKMIKTKSYLEEDITENAIEEIIQ